MNELHTTQSEGENIIDSRAEEASSPGSAPGGQFMQELVRHNEELGYTNSLNESILENLNHALVALDDSSKIIRCNRRFMETFHLPPNMGVGSRIADIFSDDRLESIIKQRSVSDDAMQETEFSCRMPNEDQDRHFLLAVSKFTLPPSGEGTMIIFDEVTEWRRRQFQVMEASRLVSIGEMAAGIAHEINNPLAAVMGFAQLALRRDIDDSLRRDLDKILAESKRASKIINNLQSFARRYKPRKEPINVIEIITKVLDFRAYELQVSNIEVVTHFDPRTPIIMGDEHQLDQAFLNIVVNAEQMMAEANGNGTLEIYVAKVGNKVHISFSDNGPGIEKSVIPKIYDPFFTTKEVGKGTGLGLSICYGIIHEHEGAIRVESAPNKGANFIIELPANATSTPDNDSEPEFFDFSKPMNRMNVLVVDDEPVVADFLARVLSEFGHDVETAESADDIIESKDLGKYNLIILDVRMPGIGGEILFDQIKQLPDNVSSRVLFITGDTTNPTTRAFIDKAGSPVLTKPFTIEDLMSAVSRLVSGLSGE